MRDERALLREGALVRHFKRGYLSEEERRGSSRYLYRVVGVATHSETREELVVYRALYPIDGITGRLFVRPTAMFLSPVDREKYPDAPQEYRFEPEETAPGPDGGVEAGKEGQHE